MTINTEGDGRKEGVPLHATQISAGEKQGANRQWRNLYVPILPLNEIPLNKDTTKK